MKRVILVATVVAVVITLLVFPASAAEPVVYTASYNEDNQLVLDALPLPGEYSISFTYCEFNTCVSVVAPSVMLSPLDLDDISCLAGSFSYDFPGGAAECAVLIIDETRSVLVGFAGFEVPLDGVDNLTLTSVAAPDPGTGSDVRTFSGSVTSGLKSVISWIGSILDSLLHGGLHDLLSLMGVAIAITALLLIAKLIRHFTWGV